MGRLRVDRMTGSPVVLRVDGRMMVERCYLATRPLARLVGLLATPDLSSDEAVWLEPCRSVHTYGLRAPIGAAFIGADGIVIKVVDPLPRGRVARAAGARAVVECRAGVL